MEGFIRGISEHPLVAIAVGFAVLLLVYFLFKSLIKFLLILLLVAVAVGGYFYIQNPKAKPADIKDAVQKARIGAEKAVEQGKETYRKGKELVEKGDKVYEQGKVLVEKGKVILDKGMEKGKETAGKVLGSDKETDR